MSLCERVKARRRELGLSQQALAQRMGAAGRRVDRSLISQIEIGMVALPAAPTIAALSDALALPAGVLLSEAGYPLGEDDASFLQVRHAYRGLDAQRRRELVLLAEALLRAQELERSKAPCFVKSASGEAAPAHEG